jgi:hypothetical protein
MKKSYERPTLVKRERLVTVTANGSASPPVKA